MSEGIGQLIAIAVMIGAFTTLMLLFEERHPLLKYLFIMGILASAFFVPTAVYNLGVNCDTQINTTTVSGNSTSYSYMNQCFTNAANTADTFYKVMWSLYQIIIAYFIIRMIYELFKPVWERMRRW